MTLTFIDANTVSAIAAAASAFVAAIALIAVTLQVYLLKKQISQDLNWKRREKALLYSQVHHPDVREARARLSTKLELGGIQTRLPWKDLQEKIAGDKTIGTDMQIILIYLENMGLAVEYEVADLGMIYDLNGTDIIRFCEIFADYIDAARGGHPRIYQNIDRLKNRLVKERDRLLATPNKS